LKIRTKITLLTATLTAALVVSIAALVTRSQQVELRSQSRQRLDVLLEGVARVGEEALAGRDRLMLFSYLMFLQKEHPELVSAAVTYQGHTSRMGADRPELVFVERYAGKGPTARYVVTGQRGDVRVSSSGVTLSVSGPVDLRTEEPAEFGGLKVRLGFDPEALDREVSKALRPLVSKTAAIAGAFLLLGSLASLYFGALLAKPIQALAAATALVAQGRMDVSVQTTSKDEIGLLAGRFNDMAKRLKALMRSREDLLHTLTHELNSPLAGLKAYLELWRSRGLPPGAKERGEALATMQEAVLRMETSLTSALRLFAEEGALRERPKTDVLWLNEVFASVLKLFSPLAASRGIRLSAPPEDALAMLYGDPETVRLIAMNLLSNALKYTPDKGAIAVGIEDSRDAVHFWVSDTGRGIAPEDRERIFTRFYRSEQDRTRIPGTGLGLSLTHKAVTAMNGRIWVESEPGKGSVFHVVLPKTVRGKP